MPRSSSMRLFKKNHIIENIVKISKNLGVVLDDEYAALLQEEFDTLSLIVPCVIYSLHVCTKLPVLELCIEILYPTPEELSEFIKVTLSDKKVILSTSQELAAFNETLDKLLPNLRWKVANLYEGNKLIETMRWVHRRAVVYLPQRIEYTEVHDAPNKQERLATLRM